LPKTLDDTYARILSGIDEEYSQDAFKILQWLAYSARPLRVEEVAEVIAVDIDDDPRFDPENRLLESRDILTICSSLATIATATIDNGYGTTYEIEELRLAHFSVKEYLISDRVWTRPASRYNMKEYAEGNMAQTCLIYLLHFRGPTLLASSNIDEFPLIRYAAQYWTQHARAAKKDIAQIDLLSIELFQSKRGAYINWIRLFDLDDPWGGVNTTKRFENVASPLYYASLAGLVESARWLLNSGADINSQGGMYGNALQAALHNGHNAVVQQLLDSGANVNAQGGRYGNALQAASHSGHDAVVQQLLDSGADVNLQGGYFGNALQAALYRGHDLVAQRLLDSGANVNAQGGIYGNALQAASYGGHDAIIQQLLDSGADVNAQGGYFGNALQAASYSMNDTVVQQLLDSGANVNAQGGRYGNALQAASYKGHNVIVQRLLGSGADVNAQGRHYGNALQAASHGGHDTVIQQLLDSGADVNAQGGHYGNALQAALHMGHDAVVQRLLESGANKVR
jgi:ankyrin repeat protein